MSLKGNKKEEYTLQNVTINIVAKEAGVSKKTVSRVLNNEENVSQATRLKVQATVKALGYKPNPLARGLATNQSFLIGLVYDNPNKSYISDIQTGALSVCQQNEYHLLIHPMEHTAVDLIDQLKVMIDSSRLDGLVLTPPFSDMHELLKMLNEISIPYVRIAPTKSLTESPCVISNDVEAAYEMTQHLISLGHKKIAFIKGHPDHHVSAQRFNGYQKALQDNGLKLNLNYVNEGDFTFESGEVCARQLLQLDKPPTAIFASNDYMAAGVLKVANQKEIQVPQSLSITGFDNAPITSYIWPSLTTVKQPVVEQASIATTMLIQLIRKQPLANHQQQLKDELIIRESSGSLEPMSG